MAGGNIKSGLKCIWLVSGFVFVTILKCQAAPANSESQAVKVYTGPALFQGPRVFLTVSPEAGYRKDGNNTVLLDRMLEMHWEHFQTHVNDKIALYNENPATMTSSELKSKVLEEYPANATSGSYKTGVRYDRRPVNASMEPCLGFYVAYLRNENDETTVLKSNCFRVYPTWMHDLRNEISKIPLHSILIPGTHDAGSWIYYAGEKTENVVVRYTYSQDDTIYEQLINGIRSLDVRVGYYKTTEEKFYVNHDIIQIRPLKTLLDDVRKFILETNEIVFLDFHRFPVGFTDHDIHKQLVTFLQKEIGDILAPKSLTLSATPEDLWKLNRTAILLYNDDATVAENDFLWPGVQQAWAQTNNLTELESYLDSYISKFGCNRNAWSAMAELTPTTRDFFLNSTFGLRGFANLSNNNVTEWYEREGWYTKSMIVALDFYLGTNLIETAVEVNKNNANICV